MSKTAPFGMEFAKIVPVSHDDLPYNPSTQSANVSDGHLASLAACDNTLTGTAGPDNDFDDG